MGSWKLAAPTAPMKAAALARPWAASSRSSLCSKAGFPQPRLAKKQDPKAGSALNLAAQDLIMNTAQAEDEMIEQRRRPVRPWFLMLLLVGIGGTAGLA